MLKVTEQNFAPTVGKSGVAILVFSSAYCPTCDQLERVLQEISGEMDGPIPMAKVDITESPDLTYKFGILGIPTMVCLRDGQSVHQITLSGRVSKVKIAQLIKQNLGA